MSRLSTPKTIVVTGGHGFIGSHFIEKCLAAGHKIINVDKLTYAANKDFDKGFNQHKYRHIWQDIAELPQLPPCDIIVNFAAESHVDNSIEANDIFLRSNIVGPHKILELIKSSSINNRMHGWHYKMPLFVQISTDEVFGDILEGGFKEDDVHTPSNPYSATKSAAEQLVVSWGRTYGIPYIITRTTNNYGPRQHPEKLIPAVITRLLRGDKAVVHGDGSYVRNWIHVIDNVDALYMLIDEAAENQSYHIASPEEYSVREIVEMVAERFGRTFDEVADMSSDRSGADLRYALDTTKIERLGWKPKHNMKDTLDETIAHYRKRNV